MSLNKINTTNIANQEYNSITPSSNSLYVVRDSGMWTQQEIKSTQGLSEIVFEVDGETGETISLNVQEIKRIKALLQEKFPEDYI